MDEYLLILSEEEGHAELIFDAKEIYVNLLWVNEGARRQGTARQLMTSVIALSGICNLPVRLNARSDNVSDGDWIAFFESLGFVVTDAAPWTNEMRLN